MSVIYQIKNKLNNKIYIGSTNNKTNRWNRHKWELRTGQHHNGVLQRAWDKYGEDNFEFTVLENCNKEEQFKREQYYLDTLQPFAPNGYNLLKEVGSFTDEHKGEKHSRAKLTNAEVIEIKRMLANEELSQKQIVETTGIGWGTIGKIASVCRWKDVGSEYNDKLLSMKKKQWKDEYIKQVIMLRTLGVSFEDIGQRMGFSANTIKKKYDKHWSIW